MRYAFFKLFTLINCEVLLQCICWSEYVGKVFSHMCFSVIIYTGRIIFRSCLHLKPNNELMESYRQIFSTQFLIVENFKTNEKNYYLYKFL